MKKKLIALFCVITCVLGLSACGSERTYTEFEKDKMASCESISQVAYSLATSLDAEMSSKLFDMYNKEEMAFLFSEELASVFGSAPEVELGAFDGLLTTVNQMKSDMGGIKDAGIITSKIEGKNIIVTIPVYGNECDGQVEFTYSNDIFTRFIEGDASANTTFAQKMHEAGTHMGTAGLNTLLGMGSVFLVLLLISGIIASFSLFKAKPKKEEVKTETTVTETVEEEVTDDTELVAVIMAAISAYESANGGSADGFVVRSIKKANRRI